ncbi:MAG: hypothetical protein ACXWQ6_08445 [Candidatus Limnocylindrales bacterium]
MAMPGTPTATTTSSTASGTTLTIHQAVWSSADGNTAFITAYTDYPPGAVSGRDPESVLEGAQAGAVASVKATLVNADPVTVAGLPGRAFQATVAGGSVYGLVILNGDHLYQLVAVGSNVNASDVDAFMGSFALTP